MTELECPALYEEGDYRCDCRYCVATGMDVLYGSPSDLDNPHIPEGRNP